MSRYFPFHAIGLRANPFRALTDDEWASLARLPQTVARAFDAGHEHLQLLAPLGHGKTSALLAFQARCRAAGTPAAYEYVPEGAGQFHNPLAGLKVFLLDEAQRLSRRERSRLLAAGRHTRLVLASHHDLTPHFARAGLPLCSLQLLPLDLPAFEALIQQRLAFFGLPGGPRHHLAPAALQALHAACAGNLRLAEQWLYEVFQRLPPPGEVGLDALLHAQPMRGQATIHRERDPGQI